MSVHRLTLVPLALAGAGLALAGCGSSGYSGSHRGAATPATSASNALSADATSAATGDIPDNQVFVVLRNRAAGYSMRYPEGWAVRTKGAATTLSDKNNLVRIQVAHGALPAPAAARAEVAALASSSPGLRPGTPSRVQVGRSPAVKVSYTTESTPNPVTGKRVTLLVDRYYLAHAGKRAVVELGTPRGVDNVDAYRMMIGSFRWS